MLTLWHVVNNCKLWQGFHRARRALHVYLKTTYEANPLQIVCGRLAALNNKRVQSD